VGFQPVADLDNCCRIDHCQLKRGYDGGMCRTISLLIASGLRLVARSTRCRQRVVAIRDGLQIELRIEEIELM
jgi:hypothetical protein